MGRLGAAAAAYAARGLAVFPIKTGGKTPLTAHGFKDASADAATVAKWWAKHPTANIGLPTGPLTNVLVLDVDGAAGSASLALLEQAHGPLPATPFQRTGKGRHFLFLWPPGADIGNSAGKLGEGLDTRGRGGYIVLAPSVHPSGAEYAWDAECRPSRMAFAPAPDWLLEMLRRSTAVAPVTIARPNFAELPDTYARKALEGEFDKVARAGNGTRNDALNRAGYSLGGLIPAGIVSRGTVESTLTAAAAANGQLAEDGPAAIAAVIRSSIDAGIAAPRTVEVRRPQGSPQYRRAQMKVVSQSDAIEEDDEPEDRELTRTSRGEIKADSIRNAVLMLAADGKTRGLFARNDFTNQVMVTRRPPWTLNGHQGGALGDSDIAGCVQRLERRGLSISLSNAHAAIDFIASENHVHPVRDALNALQWDGEPRLSQWLADYMGAPSSAFVSTVAAKFMIGAVARIMNPGAKVDSMLILEGPQGLKKSTGLAVLATIDGREYFADKLPALGSKDAAMELQGKVIIEIAELDALHKAEVSQVKAWLTQRVDRFRPPYGRTVIELPRQCVFAGTVNPGAAGYLNDPTGGRRFWPVAVSEVDLAGLRKVTDQLWAEAVARWRDGEQWWIEEDEVLAEAREAQRERYDADVWADRIDKYVALRHRVRVVDVLTEELEIPKHLLTDSAKKRVASHLRFSGWSRRKWRDPLRDRQPTWYFVRDDMPPEMEDPIGE